MAVSQLQQLFQQLQQSKQQAAQQGMQQVAQAMQQGGGVATALKQAASAVNHFQAQQGQIVSTLQAYGYQVKLGAQGQLLLNRQTGILSRALGSVSPRMVLSAIRGNLSNTGRNLALGAAAGVVGLGAAASPIGIQVIVGPLRLIAAVLGSIVLPALVKFGASLLDATKNERLAKQLPPETIGDKFHNFMVGVNSALTGVATFLGTGSLKAAAAATVATGMSLTAARQAKRLHDAGLTDSKKQNIDSQRMILQEMQLALGGHAAVGKAEEAWSRIQTGMVMSPFEKMLLDIQRENLNELQKSVNIQEKAFGGANAVGR